MIMTKMTIIGMCRIQIFEIRPEPEAEADSVMTAALLCMLYTKLTN